jgi:hypothetical protein
MVQLKGISKWHWALRWRDVLPAAFLGRPWPMAPKRVILIIWSLWIKPTIGRIKKSGMYCTGLSSICRKDACCWVIGMMKLLNNLFSRLAGEGSAGKPLLRRKIFLDLDPSEAVRPGFLSGLQSRFQIHRFASIRLIETGVGERRQCPQYHKEDSCNIEMFVTHGNSGDGS